MYESRVECVTASWTPDGQTHEYVLYQLSDKAFMEAHRQMRPRLEAMPCYFCFTHVDRQIHFGLLPQPNLAGTFYAVLLVDGREQFLRRHVSPSELQDKFMLPLPIFLVSPELMKQPAPYFIGMDTAKSGDDTSIVMIEVVDGNYLPRHPTQKFDYGRMVELFLGVENGNASSGDLDALYDEPDFLTSWFAHQAAEAEERAGLHYPGVWPPPREGKIL